MALGKIQEKKEKSKVIIDMCRGGGTLPALRVANQQIIHKQSPRRKSDEETLQSDFIGSLSCWNEQPWECH